MNAILGQLIAGIKIEKHAISTPWYLRIVICIKKSKLYTMHSKTLVETILRITFYMFYKYLLTLAKIYRPRLSNFLIMRS